MSLLPVLRGVYRDSLEDFLRLLDCEHDYFEVLLTMKRLLAAVLAAQVCCDSLALAEEDNTSIDCILKQAFMDWFRTVKLTPTTGSFHGVEAELLVGTSALKRLSDLQTKDGIAHQNFAFSQKAIQALLAWFKLTQAERCWQEKSSEALKPLYRSQAKLLEPSLLLIMQDIYLAIEMWPTGFSCGDAALVIRAVTPAQVAELLDVFYSPRSKFANPAGMYRSQVWWKSLDETVQDAKIFARKQADFPIGKAIASATGLGVAKQ